MSSAVAATCPGCGASAAPDFAFCPRCGTRLGTPPLPRATPGAGEADRRPVTVLFADVAGFTALGERLDPEDLRAFQDDLFRELSGALQRHGGFAEKFVGDAVMVTFGAPVAHEDDPERAVRAALAMHQAMTAVNGLWERRLGHPLALHVGVHSGPVVAGTLGSAADGAYAVTGDTVNTAARLQGLAAPGETLVSRATYLLTRHAFAFESAGEARLKGKSEPVPVYRLIGPLATPRPRRGLEALGLAGPLVGRDAELGQMQAAFDRVAAGRAEVLGLLGEAGVGKSRLLDEWLARLEAAGRLAHATVRRAAASSAGEPPYGILAAFVRQGYGIAPTDPPEGARQKLAAGLEALGAGEAERACLLQVAGHLLGLERDPLAAHVDPEQLHRQILGGMRLLLERRLAGGPVVLVVEDLHWADAASVELLCFLADRLADRPLFLLYTARPGADVAALAPGRTAHTVIRLEPLSADDGRALLAGLLDTPAGALTGLPLCERILARAGGNPFYLEELVRELLAAGALVREGERWAWGADAGPLEVPLTVQGLILARFDRLPPAVRRVAQEAAILGLEFEARLLREIAAEAADCDGALARLEQAGLLRRAGDARYAFAHALIQETIYQNVLLRRRTELHGRAGQALEALVGGEPGAARLEDLEALGRHWSLSADRLKGARYLTQAGDRARAVYANADAIRHYERALRTLETCETGDEEREAVRERLADVLALTGRREAARQHYEAVGKTAAAAGDRPTQARICRKLAGLHWEAGERVPALGWLRTGLDLLAGWEHIEVAHLYQEMGRLAFRGGDHAGALAWSERALLQAERLAGGAGPGGPEEAREATAAVAQARNTRGVALARFGRLEEAVVEIERSVEIARRHDLLQAACRGYANLGVLYSTLDPRRAIETCRLGLEVATRIGDLGVQSRLYANLAVAYCALTNRCDDAGLAAARAAVELDRRLGQLDHLAVPLIVLGQIHQCHGAPAEARRYYLEALALAEPVGEPQLLFPCYDGLATLHLDAGDEAGAEAYMRRAQQVCEGAGLEPDALTVLPFLY